MGAYNVVNRSALAAGQPEDISVVLANLDAIAAVINGGIDNSNVAAGAAIIPSKISPGSAGQVLGLLAGVSTWLGGLAKIQDIPALVATAATLDFSSIPADYKHLMLIVEAQETGVTANDDLRLRFNNDSGSAYSHQYGYANAAAATAVEQVTGTSGFAGFIIGSSFASGWGSSIIFIPNYRANRRKNWLGLTFSNSSDATGGFAVRFFGGVYRQVVVLDRITLLPATGNFQIGSTATLYGLGV